MDVPSVMLELPIYNSVVGNSRTFLLSPNLQRNTGVHKTLNTDMHMICGTVLIVRVSASLTNDGNLSHFDSNHTPTVYAIIFAYSYFRGFGQVR